MILKIIITFLLIIIAAFLVNIIQEIKTNNKCKFSIKESLELAGLPIITFYNNDVKLNFLLDTGSTDSIINSSMLSVLKTTANNTTKEIISASGNSIPSKYCDMEITYNNNTYMGSFAIIDLTAAFKEVKDTTGVQLQGIIGSSFLQKYKYMIDFKELVVYQQ